MLNKKRYCLEKLHDETASVQRRRTAKDWREREEEEKKWQASILRIKKEMHFNERWPFAIPNSILKHTLRLSTKFGTSG